MRTYNRSQVVQKSPVVKIKDLCRLCMVVDATMHDIFDVNQYSLSVPLASKILNCLAIEVKNHEWFPTKICQNCLKSLDAFAEFRERCHLANERLESLYEKSVNSVFASKAAFSALPHIAPSSDRSQSPQHSNEGLRVLESRKSLHPVDDSSNIYLEDQPHLYAVQNNLSRTSDETAQDLPGNLGEVSKNVLSESECDIRYLNVTADANTTSKVDFEEVSDIDESGDALEVQVLMNGNSYVIEVLEETNERQIELSEKSDLSSPKEPVTVDTDTERKVIPSECTTYQCSCCKRIFINSLDLKNHVQEHAKGFSCQLCYKWFSCKSGLQRHEKIHSGEKPYKCTHCSRSFSQKEILRRHVLTHSGDKPFKCSSCHKSYTQKKALKMHVKNNHVPRKSTDIVQYQCSLCDKSFCHLSGLSRHQKFHAGKKYPCNSCDRVFTDQSCLRRHNQRVHLAGKT